MDLDITADDFVLFEHPLDKSAIPYIYSNFGVTSRLEYDEAEKKGSLKYLPSSRDARSATEIEPSSRAGLEH